jgi:hypothetical protein
MPRTMHQAKPKGVRCAATATGSIDVETSVSRLLTLAFVVTHCPRQDMGVRRTSCCQTSNTTLIGPLP